jgi:hypothetical protein
MDLRGNRPEVPQEAEPGAIDDQSDPDADDHDSGERHQPAAASVPHRLGSQELLLGGLAGTRSAESRDGGPREPEVDDRPPERLQARPCAAAVAGDAERRLGEAPQRVPGEAQGHQRDDDVAVGFGQEFLKGALLIGAARVGALREQQPQDADDDPDRSTCGQPGPGCPADGLALGGRRRGLLDRSGPATC